MLPVMKSEGQSIEDIDTIRKRLIYRSWHRGTREMDLLLGSFADKFVPAFSGAELRAYNDLLQQNDPDLYNWIIGVEKPPANIISDMFEKLKNHAFVKTA
jgi:antitoxin CptB